MSVRVNEPRQDDAVARIDHFAIVADETFNLTSTAYRFDGFAAHQHRPIFDNRELTEITTGAWTLCARERN
jgi:hypothetical protein